MVPPFKLYSQEEVAELIAKMVYTEFHTVSDAANYYGVSRSYLYKVMDAAPGKYPNEAMLQDIGFEKEAELFFRKLNEDNEVDDE